MGAGLACCGYFPLCFQVIALQYTVMGKISQGKVTSQKIRGKQKKHLRTTSSSKLKQEGWEKGRQKTGDRQKGKAKGGKTFFHREEREGTRRKAKAFEDKDF